ncbi:zinc ABC transporter substrate-binding protein [Actinokineospora sp. NBRC 105648]|uniref:metal ABC transporter solute-binding protein, Zn/Mn family n=1 Tax=Actinokineospora sp. NBRC 105648 TaxID=3032206 RepID=UPI0024A578D4|nr:zinc ABC transporter substrate-binding protein [Actinokineospora sp. NBRC 105648]GLZ40382.1 metal ABC transporter substrate-binding protein [Actinokineospora sp. NBRC 105648]
MTSRPTRSATAAALVGALTLIGASACGGSPGQAGADGRIAVVASTNVWASVARAVGGDAVSVTAILSDPGADPHGYEAKPADAVAFDNVKVVLSNGGGYDDFFTGLADTAGANARKIVAFELAGKGDSGGQHQSSEPVPNEAAHEPAVNEHVWYDLDTVHRVADKLVDELSAVAPDKRDVFRTNAATFAHGLDDIAAKAAGIGRAKPGAKVVATEPVAAYLLATAGLSDATPEEFSEAIEEESDPSAAAVAKTDALVTDKEVAVVVYNSQTETPVTKQLKDKAVAAGVPVVGVTETLPPGATDYLAWMTTQVDDLARAVAAA